MCPSFQFCKNWFLGGWFSSICLVKVLYCKKIMVNKDNERMSFKTEAELLINKCNQCPVNTCRKKFTMFLIGIEKFLPALKKFVGSALAYWDHGEGQAMWGRATSRI